MAVEWIILGTLVAVVGLFYGGWAARGMLAREQLGRARDERDDLLEQLRVVSEQGESAAAAARVVVDARDRALRARAPGGLLSDLAGDSPAATASSGGEADDRVERPGEGDSGQVGQG